MFSRSFTWPKRFFDSFLLFCCFLSHTFYISSSSPGMRIYTNESQTFRCNYRWKKPTRKKRKPKSPLNTRTFFFLLFTLFNRWLIAFNWIAYSKHIYFILYFFVLCFSNFFFYPLQRLSIVSGLSWGSRHFRPTLSRLWESETLTEQRRLRKSTRKPVRAD